MSRPDVDEMLRQQRQSWVAVGASFVTLALILVAVFALSAPAWVCAFEVLPVGVFEVLNVRVRRQIRRVRAETARLYGTGR